MMFESLAPLDDVDPDGEHCRTPHHGANDFVPCFTDERFKRWADLMLTSFEGSESDLWCSQKSPKAWKHWTSSW